MTRNLESAMMEAPSTAWGAQPGPASGTPPPPPSLVSTGSSPSHRCVGSLTSGLALSTESPRSAPLEEGPSYGNPQSIIGTPQPCPALGPAGLGSWDTLPNSMKTGPGPRG